MYSRLLHLIYNMLFVVKGIICIINVLWHRKCEIVWFLRFCKRTTACYCTIAAKLLLKLNTMLDSNYPLQPPYYPLSAAYIWKIYNSAILFFHPVMLAWTVHCPLAHDEGTCCTHSRVLSSRPLAILSDTYTQSSVRVNGRGPSGTEPTHPFKTLSFSSLIYQKRSTWGTEAIM